MPGGVLAQYEELEIYDEIWRYQIKEGEKERKVMFLKEVRNCLDGTVWIWQPGKVASMTLMRRLQRIGIPCIHSHRLQYPAEVLHGELEDEWNRIIREKTERGIKIVTAVREPLARAYAAFWQAFTGERSPGWTRPIFQTDFQKSFHDFMMCQIGDDCAVKLKTFHPIEEFEWFNREIKGILGVDALPEENDNIAEEKLYGLVYKEFREYVKFPKTYVEYYYKDNPYMDHFYTEKEKKVFLEKWEKNILK